jgi:dienelactone hydrolase
MRILIMKPLFNRKFVFLVLVFSVLTAKAAPLALQNSTNEPYQAHVYPATNFKEPTVIALHGCGGMLNAISEPNNRTNEYAKLLNAQGWHVVFLDSLTPRGVKSVCGGLNNVTQAQRLQDTRAAVNYFSQQPWVDAQRMAIMGWSHGGTATLLASAKGVNYAVPPKAAVAFYPGCGNAGTFERAGWQPAFPLLMQLGAADDWTDPVPCQQLAAKHGIAQTTYPNAHHGFDSDAKVVQVKSVTSRTTGQPVHAGGEPAAKAAAQAALIAFFKRAFE